MVLANTYHLLLRPGADRVQKLGGLHRFMGWNGPILTDSGGYQVFSLGPGSRFGQNADTDVQQNSLVTVDDNGVEFASHLDGTRIRLDPENAIQIQNRLGADIIMCLDQCTPFPCDSSQLKQATQRTVRWARRSKRAHTNSGQLLFGIVQGGIDVDLRTYCASELVKMGFDGYAIGGLSVGEGHENMVRTVIHTTKILPEDRPRYLMGVGTPADIIAAVRAGVDMFDCVLPTRNGRNAFAFTENGPLRLRNSIHATSTEPIEPGCDCYCCTSFARGTIRHFFSVSEMLGPIMVSLHNLRFYQRLMARIRQAIETNTFSTWADEQLQRYESLGENQALNT
jgi:queuine tRNA-ribosyltransferase